MDVQKWRKVEDILDKYNVKPLVGIIPNCEDIKMMVFPEDNCFWERVHSWEKKGWNLALHGYNHVYSSMSSGLNPMWKKSEFAGVPIELQREKIQKGIRILHDHSLSVKCFFAPSHTFDENTLEALKQESSIRIVSDTIAFYPYKMDGLVFVPQQFGHCIALPFGVWTFCFHPNTMSNKEFVDMELFLKKHQRQFISFDELDFQCVSNKTFFDRMFYRLYFSFRLLLRKK